MSRFVKSCLSLLLVFILCLVLQPVPCDVDAAPVPFRQRSFTNSIGMTFLLIPPGKFLMGSPNDEKYRLDDEGPQHEVEISKPFYLGVYEVTQKQYRTIMGENPSFFSSTGESKESSGA
jgi:formylglycine-generating enzyme required for sulfatase activity